MTLTLVAIGPNGQLPASLPLNDPLPMIVDMTVQHYTRVGFAPPWNGYLAVENSVVVGTCAFKAPPADMRVEIAYCTLPEQEGRGIATAMARELIQVARQEDVALIIVAQTLPEENASTSILKKLGFQQTRTIEHPEDGLVWEWELNVRDTAF